MFHECCQEVSSSIPYDSATSCGPRIPSSCAISVQEYPIFWWGHPLNADLPSLGFAAVWTQIAPFHCFINFLNSSFYECNWVNWDVLVPVEDFAAAPSPEPPSCHCESRWLFLILVRVIGVQIGHYPVIEGGEQEISVMGEAQFMPKFCGQIAPSQDMVYDFFISSTNFVSGVIRKVPCSSIRIGKCFTQQSKP